MQICLARQIKNQSEDRTNSTVRIDFLINALLILFEIMFFAVK